MTHSSHTFEIRKVQATDASWLNSFLAESWGSSRIVSRGRLHDAARLPGFVATIHGRPVGLVTYHTEGRDCEIVTMQSNREGIGIGSALIEAVKDAATNARCSRLWLVTTNDNIDGLRFYQKRGFHLVAVHRKAVDSARDMKPEIPIIGAHGIRIRDEIELEIRLGEQ